MANVIVSGRLVMRPTETTTIIDITVVAIIGPTMVLAGGTAINREKSVPIFAVVLSVLVRCWRVAGQVTLLMNSEAWFVRAPSACQRDRPPSTPPDDDIPAEVAPFLHQTSPRPVLTDFLHPAAPARVQKA
jgi:hypothetical protein